MGGRNKGEPVRHFLVAVVLGSDANLRDQKSEKEKKTLKTKSSL